MNQKADVHCLRPARMRRAAAALLLLLTLSVISCKTGTQPGNATPANVQPTASPTPSPAASRLTIDGDRAFEHVRKQVEFGPRPAGSPELAKTREYIVGELKSYGLDVTLDEFTAKTPAGEKKMANIVAELPGESGDVIILSSHYDTKLFKEFRFVGANDGGSSTGALLELARAIKSAWPKPRFTYRFVFFDGEEAFCKEWDDCKNPDGPDNTYGSRHYVRLLKERKELDRVGAMILLDMIGYKQLQIPQDDTGTTWINDIIWQSAREAGYGREFVDEVDSVTDDHVPFMQAGVECVDLIQLSTYPHWHEPEDTLDKISPRSLKVVGDVVMASLPRIEDRLLRTRPAS